MPPRPYQLHAPELVDRGYDTTPVAGKKPQLAQWSRRPDTARDYESHGDANVGVLCGGNYNLIAIDVDVSNPFASNELLDLALEILGNAPRRVGRPPRFLLPYRCTEQLRKSTSSEFEVDGDKCCVEILGEGQQFVALGEHPSTRADYNWPDESILDYAASELTMVTPEQVCDLLRQAERVLEGYGPRTRDNRPAQTGADLQLGNTANDNTSLIHEIRRGGHWHDPMLRLSASLIAKGVKRDETIALLMPLRRDGYTEEQTHREIAEMVDSAIEKGFEPRKPVENKANRARVPIQTPREVFEAEPIEWLVEGLLPKIGVGLISGASGSFKSYIAGYLALCVANGRAVTDQCTVQQGPVLFAAHEGRIGMARRLVASTERYGMSDTAIALWQGITLASETDIDWLLEQAERRSFVIIDTLSKATAGIDENSNSEMALAIERAYRLADAWGCFVLIVAHTGKDETRGTRGASALKANVDTVLKVRRSGNSRKVAVTVEKQKDAEDELRIDFTLENTDVVNGRDGEVSGELVPVPSSSNPSAQERILSTLAAEPDMTIGQLYEAVTEASRMGRYQPVTRDAVKVAAGRAVERGLLIKNGGKYSLPEALGD